MQHARHPKDEVLRFFELLIRFTCTMKTHSHLSIRSGSAAFLLLAGIFLIVPMIAWGHNLDQRFTYINLDPDTLDMMRAR